MARQKPDLTGRCTFPIGQALDTTGKVRTVLCGDHAPYFVTYPKYRFGDKSGYVPAYELCGRHWENVLRFRNHKATMHRLTREVTAG